MVLYYDLKVYKEKVLDRVIIADGYGARTFHNKKTRG